MKVVLFCGGRGLRIKVMGHRQGLQGQMHLTGREARLMCCVSDHNGHRLPHMGDDILG